MGQCESLCNIVKQVRINDENTKRLKKYANDKLPAANLSFGQIVNTALSEFFVIKDTALLPTPSKRK